MRPPHFRQDSKSHLAPEVNTDSRGTPSTSQYPDSVLFHVCSLLSLLTSSVPLPALLQGLFSLAYPVTEIAQDASLGAFLWSPVKQLSLAALRVLSISVQPWCSWSEPTLRTLIQSVSRKDFRKSCEVFLSSLTLSNQCSLRISVPRTRGRQEGCGTCFLSVVSKLILRRLTVSTLTV